MTDITQNCRLTGKAFTITDEDQAFYAKMNVPMPTLCPEERHRRRIMHRNENTLYRRNCDLCKKVIIAMYDEHAPWPVYCIQCWWGDAWDATAYGRDFDFSRPFFEQFRELQLQVPKAAVLNLNNENSDYNTFAAFSRNIYMSAGTYQAEDSYFLRKSQSCQDCLNSNLLNNCELVAYSTNCDRCYQSHHLLNCRGCSFSSYLKDCIGVKNSFMCVGLHQQEHCFKNQKYSPEDYQKILDQYANKSDDELGEEFRQFCESVNSNEGNRTQVNCEDSSGNYLQNCKNIHASQDCFDSEDSKYLTECADVKDSMDLSSHDKEIIRCYELGSGGEKNYETKFSYCTCASPFSEYMVSCFYLSNSFGCDNMNKRNKFCILNKSYSEEDYNALREQIIEHMKKTGEYGEFFPAHNSMFAYNETLAQDIFPLTQAEAEAKGYRWKTQVEQAHQSSDISQKSCIQCSKVFRPIKQERELEVKIGLKPAEKCWDCRRLDLFAMKKTS